MLNDKIPSGGNTNKIKNNQIPFRFYFSDSDSTINTLIDMNIISEEKGEFHNFVSSVHCFQHQHTEIQFKTFQFGV